MTAFLPRIGPGPRAQRLLSRLAAVLVVGGIALGGCVLGPGPAHAADEATPDAEPTIGLALSSGVGATVAPGGSLLSSVTLDNDTDTGLSAGSVTIELNRTALPDGGKLDAWLDAGSAAGEFQSLATEPTPAVDSGSRTTAEIIVDAADLGALAPGVYPMRATLNGATIEDDAGDIVVQDVTATTVLVVAPAREHRTGVIVPVTATPADGSLLTADELTELTAPDGALTGLLEAVTGTTAILAVDPAIPAAIRMLGTRAPATATSWLASLEALPNDVFPLQFGDADAATQTHAGLPALLAPQELGPLMQAVDFPPATASPTPSPSPSPTGTPEPVLPSNAELTAIRGAQTGVLWPRGDVTDADISAFSGYLGGEVTTIVPSTSVDRPGTTHGTVGGHSVLVTDAAASDRLSAAVEAGDEATRQRELAATTGHLFYAEQRSPLVLLGLDRSETRSPVALREALSSFASPSVRLLTATSAPAASVALTGTPDQTRSAALSDMLQGEQRLVAFSEILAEPTVLLAPERIRVLRAIGVGLDDDEFAEARTGRAAQVQRVLGAVSIQQPKPVQLFTSAAPLPVWVRNELPWPVSVSLSSRPSDPRLDIQPITEVEALASSSTRVNVPIEARVASGDVQVEFRLYGTTGAPIGQPAVADVTLRADWEGIGLVILGGLIVVLFVVGLVRTVRRRRQPKPEPEPDADSKPDADAKPDAAGTDASDS